MRLVVCLCASALAACGAPRTPASETPTPPRDAGAQGQLGARAERGSDQPVWIGVLFHAGTARVRSVIPDSPAARAGVQPGDQFVALDGQEVHAAPEVIAAVQQRTPGARMSVMLMRGGTFVTLQVAVEVRPDLEQLQQGSLANRPAPPFDLATLAGGRIKLADLKGKVVLVDFWATWCKPCIASMPSLEAWHRTRAAKGLVVVGITDDDPATAHATVAEHKLTYPIALDPDHDAWAAYLVQGLPTTVLIDRSGRVQLVLIGTGAESAVEGEIDRLLQ